jgi:hypothetical protein
MVLFNAFIYVFYEMGFFSFEYGRLFIVHFLFSLFFFRTGGWGLEICFEHVYIGFFFFSLFMFSLLVHCAPAAPVCREVLAKFVDFGGRCTLVSPRWANIPWASRSLVCEKQGIEWITEENQEKIL